MRHDLASFLSGHTVAVVGLGVSNRPLISYLHRLGLKVDAFDRLPPDDRVLQATLANFRAQGIALNGHFGPDHLDHLDGYDIIIRSPGVRPDAPAFVRARRAGTIVTSEMELFLAYNKAPVIAVTGSDGKTTTTTLIATMLRAFGVPTFVGGNIGTPLLDRLDEIDEEARVVVELSSFQLETMRPHIETAVITNITPNHLDVHKTFEAYVSAKAHIFEAQTPCDRLIINDDDQVSCRLAEQARGRVDRVNGASSTRALTARTDNGYVVLDDGRRQERVVAVDAIRLPGRFNVENIKAAALAVWPDVDVATMRQVAETFSGVKHRMELIRVLDGVRYYNSSIDSSPLRSIHTLSAMAESGVPVVLITGGADKRSDYRGLGEAILRVSDRIVVTGANAPQIRQALSDEAHGRAYRLTEVDDYESALALARSWARPGDAVVLSPAGTSFDKFRHFEERGDLFRTLVEALT